MVDLPKMQGVGKLLILVVLIILCLFIGSVLFATHFVTSTINYAVDNLASRSGISPFLVRGAVIVLTIPFFAAVAVFTRNIFGLLNLGLSPLSFYRRTSGIVIVLYVAGFYLAMYSASIHATAYKYCGETPEGTYSSDGPGKDPTYGVELKPCTGVQILELNKDSLRAPMDLTIDDPDTYDWFDGRTGKARVWFAVLSNGNPRFFDHAGKDPHSGQILQPVNQDVIQRARQMHAEAQAAREKTAEVQATAERKRREDDSRAAERQSKSSDLQNSLVQAQSQYDSGDYQGARDTCTHALSIDPGNQVCLTLRQHGATKQARQLVNKGQLEYQRGDFDDAIWSADSALALDPSNAAALKLKKLAALTKPHALN